MSVLRIECLFSFFAANLRSGRLAFTVFLDELRIILREPSGQRLNQP